MSRKTKIIVTIAAGIIAGLFLFIAPHVQAADPIAGPQGLLSGMSPGCYDKGDCQLCDIIIVANNIISLILGVTGSLALVAFVMGGFWIVVSQGDSSKVQKGFKVFKSAAIGLGLVFFSYAIVNFVLNVLINSGSPTPVSFTNNLFTNEWSTVCDGSGTGAAGTAASCKATEVFDPATKKCNPVVSCTNSQVLDFTTNTCKDKPIPTCTAPQVLVPATHTCQTPITNCPAGLTPNSLTNTCECPGVLIYDSVTKTCK